MLYASSLACAYKCSPGFFVSTVAIFLLLAPHPSILFVLVKYHLQTLHAPLQFLLHLFWIYTLSFLTFSSLIICVVRDPGPVQFDTVGTARRHGEGSESIGLTEALMPQDVDFSAPGKWCRICWAPKPERAHHCSQCGRCVLKMDHHCPWLGAKCVGHRTYPAFVHFLACITLLAVYIAAVAGHGLFFAFSNPFEVDENVPVHLLMLFFTGVVITLVIGSFLCYHFYLISTNQTTIESLASFMLLRHLPPLPPMPDGRIISDPPLEHELSYRQRRLVKAAHNAIRLYDVGVVRNWTQVFGGTFGGKHGRWKSIMYLLLCGGRGAGDGRNFPRNPRAPEMLNALAGELIKVDKDI
ncbi:hypothetical protein HGRIS_005817 [Hohenbuehelia grisea]|uniref:Palmitoyltransferase n=1 Tax=Hohenbuehelia grisea TaxID=104357 RepID=A0ABR3JZ28_9AGAR